MNAERGMRRAERRNGPRQFVGIAVQALALFGAGIEGVAAPAPPVDFAREVLPVLQRACFDCHGPELQKGKLRLDTREAAFKKPGTISKGSAAKSELYRRITLSKGHDDAMPNRGEPLSKSDTDRIRAWIDAGAVWPDGVQAAKHWAYVKPVRPAVPQIGRRQAAGGNPVDAFILARLAKEGLALSSDAAPEILIRRLSLDLTGLPPTTPEIDDFVSNWSLKPDKALEKLVDRLLASRQFGVRWARPWLDYARYADSHGFQRDDFRDLWPYRDWVVNALNADMPFTQFSIEQLAGDLLPRATESQRVATGFNRSAPTNVEAGTDPEETRVNQIHDRVNTLGMVWLGATLECAQCHDHKYDPFTQRDYYGLFAFFNQTELEADRTNPKVPGSIQFKGPTMELADSSTQGARARLQNQFDAVVRRIGELEKNAAADSAAWEADLAKSLGTTSQEHVLDIADFDSTGGATHEILADKSVLISGEPAPDKDTYLVEVRTRLTGVRAIKIETLADPSLPGNGPGRSDAQRPNFVLNNFTATVAPAADDSQSEPVKFNTATASFSQANFPVANLLKADNTARSGWAISPRFHEPHWAMLETAGPVGHEGGTVLRFKLEQHYGGGRTIGRLRFSGITGPVGGKSMPADVADALKVPAGRRSAKQSKTLAHFRLRQTPGFDALETERTRLDGELKKLKPPTTLIMQESGAPRMSAMFQRGEFRTPGEKVDAHVPSVLHPLHAASSERTRLDLAKWLVSRENPLAARVTVNRFWAELFGHGLVTTPEDFGIKGERPTHPELLDWLAVEFMDNGWSLKTLLKSIVTSAAYRQSSRVSPEMFSRDDQNLLYARGPRFRLDAEAVRDNALSIAGLLSLRQGGPSIRPYQPDGLWVKVGGQRYDYVVSPGEEKYRRGIYVVWKRGAPYPSFVNFDANNRMACRVKRPRSNTPLQALTLMNDPVYVEAATAFARRVLTEKPVASAAERIAHAFRMATARTPNAAETAALLKLFESQRASAAAEPANARLAGFEVPAGISPQEFAAWYAVAAAILNLDETITKG
ncbi:MAG: DUF1553 domain-containing protein [Verrucomicrobia bacterium]|nr:DUF1553 domain-containing protein [Verrucomicrobiota bacterium]